MPIWMCSILIITRAGIPVFYALLLRHGQRNDLLKSDQWLARCLSTPAPAAVHGRARACACGTASGLNLSAGFQASAYSFSITQVFVSISAVRERVVRAVDQCVRILHQVWYIVLVCRYWWEVWLCARRFVFVFVAVFLAPWPEIQVRSPSTSPHLW